MSLASRWRQQIPKRPQTRYTASDRARFWMAWRGDGIHRTVYEAARLCDLPLETARRWSQDPNLGQIAEKSGVTDSSPEALAKKLESMLALVVDEMPNKIKGASLAQLATASKEIRQAIDGLRGVGGDTISATDVLARMQSILKRAPKDSEGENEEQ